MTAKPDDVPTRDELERLVSNLDDGSDGLSTLDRLYAALSACRAERDALRAQALGEDGYVRVPREDLEMWWFQCEQGLFTEHGECPATYACSSILSDLRDLDPSLAAAPSTSAQEEGKK